MEVSLSFFFVMRHWCVVCERKRVVYDYSFKIYHCLNCRNVFRREELK